MKHFHFLTLLVSLLLISCNDDIFITQSPKQEVSFRSQSATKFQWINFDSITSPENWIKYKTHAEQTEALMIPENILHEIPTKDLVELCFEYPMVYDYLAYNDLAFGVEQVMSKFNGFEELESRTDGIENILELYYEYCNFPIIQSQFSTYDRKSKSPLKQSFIEILMASDKFVKNFKPTQLLYLSQFLKKKIETYKSVGKISEVTLTPAVILYELIKKRVCLTDSMTDSISVMSLYPTDFTYSHIPTLNNQQVEVILNDELTENEIKELNNYFSTNYINAFIISPASAKYNCHSYAWYKSNGGLIDCWIDQIDQNRNQNISKFWTNDFFVPANNILDATRAFYSNSDHSAVVVDEAYFISKWGRAPLMGHDPEHCPYDCSNIRYYKEGGTHSTETGLLQASYGNGTTKVDQTDGYYINRNLSFENYYTCGYGIRIETSKGDDATELGYAQIVNFNYTSCQVKFSHSGIYEMYIDVYHRPSNVKIAEMWFEPIVLNN